MDKVIIYNPRNGSEINETYAQDKWKHEVNTIKRYEPQLARYLLKKYGFLIEVEPGDIVKYRKLSEAIIQCQSCDYVTDDPKKLMGHMAAKHKVTDEIVDEYEKLEIAEPVGKLRTVRVESSPESLEGIPDTKSGEKQGWYGEGLENDVVDSGMINRNIPGETPGQF